VLPELRANRHRCEVSPRLGVRGGPQNREKQKDGARLDGAQVIQEETSQAPPEQTERPEIALQREHDPTAGALLSATERAALCVRLDSKPTKADWELWGCDLEARIGAV